jgi:hypothetical protein
MKLIDYFSSIPVPRQACLGSDSGHRYVNDQRQKPAGPATTPVSTHLLDIGKMPTRQVDPRRLSPLVAAVRVNARTADGGV